MIVTINGLCEKNKGDGWIFEPPIFYPFIRAIEINATKLNYLSVI